MRRRTVVGGAGLGVLMLVGVTLAGSLSALTSRPAPPPAQPAAKPIEPGTLTASQPKLEQAVLRPADLPGGTTAYAAASPKATVRRLHEPESCTALLDPNSLIRNAHVAEATDQASATLTGPTQVSQVLTTFAGIDGAEATMRELQRVVQRCNDFQAVLDDGTPVRVQVLADPANANAGGDTYALRLTLTGGGRTTTGILTLRRAGQVLAVLRQLGTEAVSDPLKDSIRLVDLTLNRLTEPR
ncbi:MAG TPA: hypothetical protein VF062_12320 [Candidatus Limnocylindrales bacterium]